MRLLPIIARALTQVNETEHVFNGACQGASPDQIVSPIGGIGAGMF